MKKFLLVLLLIFPSFLNLSRNLDIEVRQSDPKKFNEHLHRSSGLTSEGSIHIDANWSTTADLDWCSGLGSEGSPYTIENVEINGEGTGIGILIENTREWFEIKNCNICYSL